MENCENSRGNIVKHVRNGKVRIWISNRAQTQNPTILSSFFRNIPAAVCVVTVTVTLAVVVAVLQRNRKSHLPILRATRSLSNRQTANDKAVRPILCILC